MTTSPRAVAFDLFDTLVDFDETRFPVVEVNGNREKTTSRLAYDALYGGGFPVPNYPAFHHLWLENSKAVWRERDDDPDFREVRSIDRFQRLAARLVAVPPGERDRAARTALNAHMAGIERAVVFPPARLGLLARIRDAGLPVGLLSNFDHAPAARRILERTGLAPCLDAVLISEDEGFRKPAPRLFRKMAEALGVAPADLLFVGDTFGADVAGPQGVGMPCAWLNPKGRPRPPGAPAPDFEIQDVADTRSILGL